MPPVLNEFSDFVAKISESSVFPEKIVFADSESNVEAPETFILSTVRPVTFIVGLSSVPPVKVLMPERTLDNLPLTIFPSTSIPKLLIDVPVPILLRLRKGTYTVSEV